MTIPRHLISFSVLGGLLVMIPAAIFFVQNRQVFKQQASTTINGLTVTTQTQTGIGGGLSNNQTETDVTWIDPTTNNGWTVGLIPAYGGAILSPWYEITNGTTSSIQTNLNTDTPDGLESFVINRNNTYLGTQSSSYTFFDQPPLNSPFRRSYTARIPANGNDANGLNYHITTTIYPGDPGLIVQRTDITNPDSADIPLGTSNALTSVLIGGLQQENENVWFPANGGYGVVGNTTVQGWPLNPVVQDPDYVYIIPNSGSGIATGIVGVTKTHLKDLGASSVQIQYLRDTHRLEFDVQGAFDHFPANTTQTVYTIQALKRNLTQADAVSFATDYLNPDHPIMNAGDFVQFSYDDGAYQMTAANNAVAFTHTFPGNTTTRWLTVYEVFNYNANSDPIVTLGSKTLTPGTDYVADVDTSNHIAYVKLMKPLVTANANGNQLNNELLTISDGLSQIVTNTQTPTPSPTPTDTPSPSPSPSPSPTVTPSPSPSPSPTPTPGKTVLDITLCPHGIGNCGDNANPSGLGNTNPIHTTRTVLLTLLDSNGLKVTTASGTVVYNTATKNFQGSIAIPTIASGQYLVRLKMDNFLSNIVSGIISLIQGQLVNLPNVTVTAGDVNNDNQLDIQDYNSIISCFGSQLQTPSCTNPIGSDLNDDGKVDPIDYNLFLRELSVQQGN